MNGNQLQAPPNQPNQFRFRGFTAFETIATLVIAGILSATAGVFFFGLRNPLGAATEQASGAMKYARSVAISTTSSCRINANTTSQLEIECSETCTSSTWTPFTAAGRLDLEDVEITSINGSSYSGSSPQTITCFDSQGASSTIADVVLTYQNGASSSSTQIDVLLAGAVSHKKL
ncbi:MAG: Tfp pilus assembly protein FimT/FimU [Synechococcus sp.]